MTVVTERFGRRAELLSSKQGRNWGTATITIPHEQALQAYHHRSCSFPPSVGHTYQSFNGDFPKLIFQSSSSSHLTLHLSYCSLTRVSPSRHCLAQRLKRRFHSQLRTVANINRATANHRRRRTRRRRTRYSNCAHAPHLTPNPSVASSDHHQSVQSPLFSLLLPWGIM